MFPRHTCSVSGDATYRKHVFEMAEFVVQELEALGVNTRRVDLGKHMLDGQEIELPPAILGWIGDDKSKKTVLLYAHYDVQPVRSFSTRPCWDPLSPMVQRFGVIGSIERWLGS